MSFVETILLKILPYRDSIYSLTFLVFIFGCLGESFQMTIILRISLRYMQSAITTLGRVAVIYKFLLSCGEKSSKIENV